VKHGLMRFMRAHGQTPGPGQRPRTAGAVAGAIGGVVGFSLLQWSGASASLSSRLQLSTWQVPVIYVVIWVLAGIVYGGVFQRAASDRRGGWLFGISYGFLLWMLGPITLVQALRGSPLATGTGAMGILGANLLSGLALSLCFRPGHALVRKVLKGGISVRAPRQTAEAGPSQKVVFPHTVREGR
jgi:hypothetical protein